MTTWSEDFKAKYGFGGWDDPRRTDNCLHCHGTGKCDDDNECGFCFADDDPHWTDSSNQQTETGNTNEDER